MQREDTIIGNVTIKQLIVLIIGGGLDYMIYMGFTKRGFGTPFWFPPVLIIGLITVAFAFLKINNLPFHKYILLAVERLFIPQKRMWKKGAAEVYRGIFAPKIVEKKGESREKKKEETEERKKTLSHIDRISQILDSPKSQEEVQHPEIDQVHDDELVHTAFKTGVDKKKIDKKKESIMKITARPKDTVQKKNDTPKTIPAKKEEPQAQITIAKEVIEKPTEKVEITQPLKTPEAQDKSGEINLSEKQGTITLKK